MSSSRRGIPGHFVKMAYSRNVYMYGEKVIVIPRLFKPGRQWVVVCPGHASWHDSWDEAISVLQQFRPVQMRFDEWKNWDSLSADRKLEIKQSRFRARRGDF